MTGRKVFKVFNQDFIVDERYVVNKELGQGAYGIVWRVYLTRPLCNRTVVSGTRGVAIVRNGSNMSFYLVPPITQPLARELR